MKKYNVAGIKLGFDFQYTDYFEDNIEQYQIDYDADVDYTLSVRTYKHLDIPEELPKSSLGNRHIFDFGDREVVVSVDDDKVRQYIEYSKDYRNITISMTKHQNHKLSEMEYVLSGTFFLEIALRENKLPFYASAIKHKNQAILFASPSGGGKSTHANYWHMMLDDVSYINDDQPLIHKDNDAFYVSGTPWSGKNPINTNETVPLKSIVFIEKSNQNTITKLTPNEAQSYIINNNILYSDTKQNTNTTTLLEEVVKSVPLYLLQAKNDASSVTCVYKKLFQEGANDDTKHCL